MSSIIKPVLGSQLNLGHPLSNGLVGYWLLNEGSGTKVFDLSGNGINGIFVANTSWAAGKFGTVLSFDGTNDYVNFGTITTGHPLMLTGQSITIVAWVKVTIGQACGVACKDGYYGNGDWALSLNSNQKVHLGTNFASEFISSKSIGLNNWAQIVGIIDSVAQTDYIYINGVKDTAATWIGGDSYIAIGSDQSAFTIGDSGNFLGGFVDSVLIYNRALSDAEVALLYREPFRMFERNLIELWVGSVGAVAPSGIPIFRRRRAG